MYFSSPTDNSATLDHKKRSQLFRWSWHIICWHGKINNCPFSCINFDFSLIFWTNLCYSSASVIIFEESIQLITHPAWHHCFVNNMLVVIQTAEHTAFRPFETSRSTLAKNTFLDQLWAGLITPSTVIRVDRIPFSQPNCQHKFMNKQHLPSFLA